MASLKLYFTGTLKISITGVKHSVEVIGMGGFQGITGQVYIILTI